MTADASAPSAGGVLPPWTLARAQLARQRTLTFALRGLGLAFLVLALMEADLLYGSPAGPFWVLLLFPGYGLLYAAAGMLAWSRRPANRFGAIVVLGGLFLLLAGLLNVDPAHVALIAVGLVLALTPAAAVLHLLLAFPSGRLGAVQRGLVIVLYVAAVVLQAPSYLVGPVDAPFDVLHLTDAFELARAATWAQTAVGGAVLVASAVVMVRRLRAADPTQRRALGAVTAVGIAVALFIPVSSDLAPVLGLDDVARAVAQLTAIAVVPVAFVLGALRGGFARSGSLEELGARLGSGDGTGPALRDGVAAALGDPTLELLLSDRTGTGFLDAAGAPASFPPPGGTRGVVDVELHGAAVGAIVYDATLLPQPDLVAAAGRVLAIALDRDRLIAELRASREAVRESRARIMVAADRERRRVERNLHDGAQQRLTGLALLLQLATKRAADDPELSELLADADRELGEGMTELLALARGLHPAILTDAGLPAALEALAERSAVPVDLLGCPPERLPEQIEVTAYYIVAEALTNIVAEALTNAAKHSGATLVTVCARRRDGVVRIEVVDDGHGGARAHTGSGLEGLRDRVEAVGGRLRLHSPTGIGTRLEAELPCG